MYSSSSITLSRNRGTRRAVLTPTAVGRYATGCLSIRRIGCSAVLVRASPVVESIRFR
jgi:hypothetical protein